MASTSRLHRSLDKGFLVPNRAKLGMCSHLMHAAIPCELPLPLSPQHLRVIYLTSAPACVFACHLGPPHLPLQFCLASICCHGRSEQSPVARWLLDRQVGLHLGYLASACPRRSKLPVAIRNQKSQTQPHGWASSLSYFHVTGHGGDTSFLWPAPAGEVIPPRHGRRWDRTAGAQSQVRRSQLAFDSAWDVWVRIQKSGGSRLTLLALEDGCGPIPRPHHQLAERFMETTCR